MTSSFSMRSLLAFFLLSSAIAVEQAPLGQTTCVEPPYTVHILSKSPLVIYIPNFITAEEAAHVQRVTENKFTNSAVSDESGAQRLHQTRKSKSTSIATDPIVRCIEDRALSFQGFDIPRTHLEPLQLVKYGLNENYGLHTDWFEAASQITREFGFNRLSSFYVYVTVNDITGGGTNFPLLNAPRDERWCKYIDCDEPWENGVTFRPIPGNAVFWQNLHIDGSGDRATIHAGLPLTNGTKLGMNIWTRQGPLNKEFRATEDH